MSDKRNSYHVAYHFSEGMSNGYGSTTMHLNGEISSSTIVTAIKDYIKEQNNYNNVVILNWIELKDEEFTDEVRELE